MSERNKDAKYTSVSIPTPLFEKVKERIEGTGFSSVSSYVAYVLREVLSKEVAKESAYGLKFSAEEAAKGYYFLFSASMDVKQAMAALPQVTKFAAAGNFDLARATELATDAQSSLGLKVKDSQKNLINLARVVEPLLS